MTLSQSKAQGTAGAEVQVSPVALKTRSEGKSTFESPWRAVESGRKLL